MSNQSITVDYHGQQLTAIDRNGQPWFTAAVVGRELGYTKANARIGVANLYNRHRDEFSDSDTGVIKLITNPLGGNPSTRIFSLSGIMLLGFFSNTDRAKQFRQWAKTELEMRMRSGPSNQLDAIANLQAELMRARPEWQTIVRCRWAGLSYPQIARVLGCGTATVERKLRKMRQLGLLPHPDELPMLQELYPQLLGGGC